MAALGAVSAADPSMMINDALGKLALARIGCSCVMPCDNEALQLDFNKYR